MGSCVSVHKDNPESAVKLRFSIGSKNEKLLIPSPVKQTVNGGDRAAVADVADLAVKSQGFIAAGSKDENFFDSQPWLESDCEDDFVSVNGDFTPSRGNTPVHHNFSPGTILVNKPSMEEPVGSVPEPSSPPDKKKRLSELFKESLRGDEFAGVDLESNEPVQLPKSSNGRMPSFSRAYSEGSSEKTPSKALGTEEKLLKSPQCCLPGLLSSRSYSERKKKTGPALIAG